MQRRSWIVLAAAVASVSAGFSLTAAQEILPNPAPAIARPAENSRAPALTQVYRLQRAAAADVVDSIAKLVADSAGTDVGVVGKLQLVIPEKATNSVLVVAPAHVQASVARLLEQIDRSQPQVVIQCLITRVGPDGKRTILSRPQVRTLNNQTSTIQFGQDGESLEITLTPKIADDGVSGQSKPQTN